jgi:hypothetical protein
MQGPPQLFFLFPSVPNPTRLALTRVARLPTDPSLLSGRSV